MRLNPEVMLFIDVMGALGASIVMLMFATQSSFMHATTAVYGLSMASVFPTAFTCAEGYMEVRYNGHVCHQLTERKFTTDLQVTGAVAATFVVCAALGEMIIPLIIAQTYKTDPSSFLLVRAVCSTQSAAHSLQLGAPFVIRFFPFGLTGDYDR
jgi:hypothetical protein